ncbi:MAG: hypothetical protein IM580_04860, partial [Pseudanabaena sp. M090S1SP2A07QC]|nr:hypothetical protein [Pseudanabaena sp. M090S1SP2A07QC]
FAYQGLQQLAINYQAIVIIPFSRTSAIEHQRLRKIPVQEIWISKLPRSP